MKTIPRYNGTYFKNEVSSTFYHYVGAFGSYRRSPFVTDGSREAKTEIMDYESDRWNQADDYPFLNPFSCAVTTNTEESVFVIAGWSSTRTRIRRSNTIARFKDNIWTKIGSLKQARHNHSAITV